MLRRTTFVMLATLSLFAVSARAEIVTHTGHSDIFGLGGTIDGTHNFMVLWNGDPLDAVEIAALGALYAPGTLAAPFAIGPADYLYLYQHVNDGTGGAAAPVVLATNSLGVAVGPLAPTVYGSFAATFLDTAVPIAPSGGPNPGDGPGGDLDGPASFAPTTGFAFGLAGAPLCSVSLTPTSLEADYFDPGSGCLVTLPVGAVGTLVGFVSPFPPGYFSGSLVDGGVGVFGPTPAPIPAPAAVVLGALGLGAISWVKRRRA